MILYAFLPIYLALLYRIKTVYLSFMDFSSYQLRFISLNTHRQAMLFLLSFVVVSNLACLACPILKLHAKCALKRTIQKFTKTKPSVSSFVVAIKYAHIRDLRHTKRVVQACRERAFSFTGGHPGFFQRGGCEYESSRQPSQGRRNEGGGGEG